MLSELRGGFGSSFGFKPVADADFSDHHPQLIIGRDFGHLNRDGSMVRVNAGADPTPTLSVEEIKNSGPSLKRELLRRYVHFLSVASGASTTAELPSRPVRISSGEFTLTATPQGKITLSERKGRTLEIQLGGEKPAIDMKPASEPTAPLEMMVEVFERMLLMRGSLAQVRSERDPEALALFDLLLGPAGVLNPDNTLSVDSSERYQNTKLHFWDYNGTVERYSGMQPVFRPGMADVSKTMIRMGAINAITTSMPATKPAEWMMDAGIKFNAHFGKDEVRSGRGGNKEYRGLAQAHGISVSQAPHRMMVIGDSATDAPREGDLPGVIFLHNDADTPAEAIQLLTHALDRMGNGSYAKGLEAAVGGKITDRPQKVTLGSIEFSVSIPRPDGNYTGDGPVLTDLRLASSDEGIAERLSQKPQQEQMSAFAEYQLALRSVEDGLAESRMLPVIDKINSFAEPDAVLSAIEKRQARRRSEEQTARSRVSKLKDAIGSPAVAEDIYRTAAAIARAGDVEAAKGLKTIAADFEKLNDAARDAHKEDSREFAKELGEAIDRVLGQSGDSKVGGRAEMMLKDGLTQNAGWDLIRTIEELRGCNAKDVKKLLEPIKAQIPEWLKKSERGADDFFGRRKSLGGELRRMATQAEEIASRRSAAWERIDGAISAFRSKSQA
jgi:hypothetical protein